MPAQLLAALERLGTPPEDQDQRSRLSEGIVCTVLR